MLRRGIFHCAITNIGLSCLVVRIVSRCILLIHVTRRTDPDHLLYEVVNLTGLKNRMTWVRNKNELITCHERSQIGPWRGYKSGQFGKHLVILSWAGLEDRSCSGS